MLAERSRRFAQAPRPAELAALLGDAEPDAEFSIAALQRMTGIARTTLRDAIGDGRLEARDIRRVFENPGKQASRWRITREAFERFAAACPLCSWPDCDHLGVTPAGRCSRAHALNLPGRGMRTWEHGRRIAAAKRRYWADDERSELHRRANIEFMKHSWQTGEGGPAPGRVALMGSRTRSKVFGRWAGQQAGRVGGRERGYTDLQAKGVLKLKREDPTLGRRRLAKASGLSEKQVRAILEDDCG